MPASQSPATSLTSSHKAVRCWQNPHVCVWWCMVVAQGKRWQPNSAATAALPTHSSLIHAVEGEEGRKGPTHPAPQAPGVQLETQ